MWLITFNGKLPFSYVSKKEFLEKRKKNLANEILATASGFNDVLKNIEDLRKPIKKRNIKTTPKKLKRYITMDYQPGKERYEKLLAENEKKFQPAFTKLEALLKMPATELSRPAIVKVDPDDYLSYLFTDDDDPFGKILIKPNPAYFIITSPNLQRNSFRRTLLVILRNRSLRIHAERL